MPATDLLELELMDLIFLNADFDNIGDAAGITGSTAAGNVELTIHTGTLTDASTQTTSEAAYTGYARQDIGRTGSDWTNAAGTVTNDNVIQFGNKSGGGDETMTYAGLGSDVVASELWLYGALDSSLLVSNGVNPQYAASALDFSLT